MYAVCQSYVLGLQGRINLFAAGEEQFYLDRGFVRTEESQDDMSLFELPSQAALNHLKDKGILS